VKAENLHRQEVRIHLNPLMDTPSIANILVSLDGEEIETGCELKGKALKLTSGCCNSAIRPVVLSIAPKGAAERQRTVS
jgi:hypothetical protein